MCRRRLFVFRIFYLGKRLVSSRDHSETTDGLDTSLVYLATVEDTFTKRTGRERRQRRAGRCDTIVDWRMDDVKYRSYR